ncbi:maleate cis-trans isomerase family protein [Antarctobacter jejuensis]|uniref:maleate cis-trans isomerase family protein n=1 Tax=Antarctobacter jejuensis TaxID=1439938 RepID=UPI003FD4F917
MSGFAYELTPPRAGAGALGLIVLQVDETIEGDFRRLFPEPALALHVARVNSGADLTRETIARMEVDLPGAARQLPQAPNYAAVGYACTSGTTLIGAERVAELVSGGCTAGRVCNPLSAAQAACAHLGVRSLAVVSPYTLDIAEPVCAAFEAAGIGVAKALHFGEEVEARVARIAPQSIYGAATEAARDSGAEAVFLSCTNLKTLEVIGPLERDLAMPVFGSNLALAWDMARAAGVTLAGADHFALARAAG